MTDDQYTKAVRADMRASGLDKAEPSPVTGDATDADRAEVQRVAERIGLDRPSAATGSPQSEADRLAGLWAQVTRNRR